MQWYELYNKENEPTENQIKEYVDTNLWDSLTNYIQEMYNVKPKYSFSNCSMDKGNWKGWNVKFQKSSKSLCTLYPKQGYFMALTFKDGKSHGIEVKNKKSLEETKKLVALRVESTARPGSGKK
jgi:hypothetical protein